MLKVLTPAMHARPAKPEDAVEIARIYNQGIADRTATFETRPRTEEDIRAWLDGVHPLVVVEERGAVVAFAATFVYRPRECYAGIAEVSVYVDRAFRRHGAGRMALEVLMADAVSSWKTMPAAGWWNRWAFARSGSTRSTANWMGRGAM
jgi:phosphinothricin acetyltransferase